MKYIIIAYNSIFHNTEGVIGMNDNLAEIFGEKKKRKAELEPPINASEEHWPAGAEFLYERIEEWLSDLIDEGIVSVSYEPVTIEGTTYARRLILKAGEDVAEFIPAKRLTVGTTGRIEMRTGKMHIELIRDMDGIWKHVISKPPLKVEILSQKYLRRLLNSLLQH